MAWPMLSLLMVVGVLDATFGLMLLMKERTQAGCLVASNCSCTWRGGKLVADCSALNLSEVPENDYVEQLLANSGGSQLMSSLSRDIQQLQLTKNKLIRLNEFEFLSKKFRNLQKLFLASNEISWIHSSAFQRLSGLVELDLSSNQLVSLWGSEHRFLGTNIRGSRLEENVEHEQEEPQEEEEEEEEEEEAKQEDGTKERDFANRRPASFLDELAALRQLNLASNQLTRIPAYAFRALSQLRQLYLSRNKISSIDKRAFDGLDVLNILHLELHRLEAQSVLNLGQLHQLQLAGPNPWNCDCWLAELAAALLGPGSSSSVLQDQPACWQDGTPIRLWKDTALAEFECAPRAAASLIGPLAALQAAGPQPLRPNSDRDAGGHIERLLSRQNGQLGLTCAQELASQHQLRSTRLQWLRRTETKGWQPLQPASDKYALIDYVTRANRSETKRGLRGLVRVSHLVPLLDKEEEEEEEMKNEIGQRDEDPKRDAAAQFKCIISNIAGQLELHFEGAYIGRPVANNSTSRQLDEWWPSGQEAPQASMAGLQGPSLEWAHSRLSQLARESQASKPGAQEQSSPEEEPLFVPIHVPDECLTATSSALSSSSVEESGVEAQEQQPQNDSHRVRQAAGQPSQSASVRAAGSQENESRQHRRTQAVRTAARHLINRYTSNRRALIDEAPFVALVRGDSLSKQEPSGQVEQRRSNQPAARPAVDLTELATRLAIPLACSLVLVLLLTLVALSQMLLRARRGHRVAAEPGPTGAASSSESTTKTTGLASSNSDDAELTSSPEPGSSSSSPTGGQSEPLPGLSSTISQSHHWSCGPARAGGFCAKSHEQRCSTIGDHRGKHLRGLTPMGAPPSDSGLYLVSMEPSSAALAPLAATNELPHMANWNSSQVGMWIPGSLPRPTACLHRPTPMSSCSVTSAGVSSCSSAGYDPTIQSVRPIELVRLAQGPDLLEASQLELELEAALGQLYASTRRSSSAFERLT